MTSRDSACHQGTSWPWLMRPFITAYRKVHADSPETHEKLKGLLSGLEAHIETAGLGHISELADADPLHNRRWLYRPGVECCGASAGNCGRYSSDCAGAQSNANKSEKPQASRKRLTRCANPMLLNARIEVPFGSAIGRRWKGRVCENAIGMEFVDHRLDI